MKAKYILEALDAMRAAENLSYTTDPKMFGTTLARLFSARVELMIRSGLAEHEVPIETDSTPSTN